MDKSGRWGPYRQASPPPARHRPGARSARRERWCSHCIADQSSQGVFAMRLSSWLRAARSLLVLSGTEKEHRPARLRKRALAARLSVERLEDRTVPSTFTVGNLADSGPGSLRQAVLDANANPGADLIVFAPAARDGTIALTGGELSVTGDLTIDGPGADRLTVSGNHASRVFDISANTTVTIAGMTMIDGLANGSSPVLASTGGAILNYGNLTLSSDVLSHNQAVGDAGTSPTGRVGTGLGGGVANLGTATLTISNSVFTGNQALGADGSNGNGAGSASGG